MHWLPMAKSGSWRITWAPSVRGPRRSPGTSTRTNENGPRRIPANHPGPALRRAWDARAWAAGRPDKVLPQPGEDLTARWLAELAALGYRDRDVPTGLTPTPVGCLDREQAVERVLARLGAARSGWNAADVRGEVEQLLAAAGIVTDPSVRIELAEDLTARTMDRCVPLLDRDGVTQHIRAWTSAPVLAVEADLTARLAARATERPAGVPDTDPATAGRRHRCAHAAGPGTGCGSRRARRPAAPDRDRGCGRRRQDHHLGRHPDTCSPSRVAG